MIHLNNIVIVGVGGTGLSAIAGILHDLGYQNVIGIDARESQITRSLSDRGIQIIIGHGQYEVQPDDFVIYSDIQAIYDGPEVQQSLVYQYQETKHYHLPMTYNQFIAELTKHFRTMAITGTNGKSSTTALAITAGVAGSQDFALGIVGAMLPDHNQQNYVIGQGHEDYLREVMDHILRGTLMTSPIKQSVMVLEACEHREHFLMYDAAITITTNLTHDHHDYYPTLESYHDAFIALRKKTQTVIIVPETDDALVTLAHDAAPSAPIVPIVPSPLEFDHVRGSFRSYNGSFALAAREQIDTAFDHDVAMQALQGFTGLRRRMEYLGALSTGTRVYSDYGHHPDAFQRLIPEMQSQFPDHRVVVIFEPHQARRLLSLRDDFVQSIGAADQIIIYRPYTAREQWDELQDLLDDKLGHISHDPDDLGAVFAQAVDGRYVGSANRLEEALASLTAEDVVLVASAGHLDQVMRSQIHKS